MLIYKKLFTVNACFKDYMKIDVHRYEYEVSTSLGELAIQ